MLSEVMQSNADTHLNVTCTCKVLVKKDSHYTGTCAQNIRLSPVYSLVNLHLPICHQQMSHYHTLNVFVAALPCKIIMSEK